MFIFSRTAVHYTFSHVKGLLDSKQFTMLHRKDLQVYTPSGGIGSQLVTSGPLVEAIAGWDVTCCEATQPSDRRQILNYLVNPMGEKTLSLRSYIMSHLKHGWDMLGHSEIVFGDSGTMRSFRDSGIFWTTQTMNRTT